MVFHRRAAIAALPVIVIAGCTSSKINGVTTETLDMAKVTAEAHAIGDGLAAVLMAPSIAILLGPQSAIASIALKAVLAAVDEIDAMSGGTISIVFDAKSVQTKVDTIIRNAEVILNIVQIEVPKIGGTVGTTIGTYLTAIQTLLPFLQLAAGVATIAVSGKRDGSMTEAKALVVLRRPNIR